MRKRFFWGLISILSILVLFTNCKQEIKEPKKTGSILGRAFYGNENVSDYSGIQISLCSTNGLQTVDYCKSRGIATQARAVTNSTITDSNGNYSFKNVPAGVYTVYASSYSSTEKAVTTNVVVKAGKSIVAEDLGLTATGSIKGKITIDGVLNNSLGLDVFIAGTSYIAKVDSNGNYEISDIPARTGYMLCVQKGEYTKIIKESIDVEKNQCKYVETVNILSSNWETASFKWLGSFESAPSNPNLYEAYFNEKDGCSYIWTGEKWELLAQSGKDGADGEDGADGKDGVNGIDGKDLEVQLAELITCTPKSKGIAFSGSFNLINLPLSDYEIEILDKKNDVSMVINYTKESYNEDPWMYVYPLVEKESSYTFVVKIKWENTVLCEKEFEVTAKGGLGEYQVENVSQILLSPERVLFRNAQEFTSNANVPVLETGTVYTITSVGKEHTSPTAEGNIWLSEHYSPERGHNQEVDLVEEYNLSAEEGSCYERLLRGRKLGVVAYTKIKIAGYLYNDTVYFKMNDTTDAVFDWDENESPKLFVAYGIMTDENIHFFNDVPGLQKYYIDEDLGDILEIPTENSYEIWGRFYELGEKIEVPSYIPDLDSLADEIKDIEYYVFTGNWKASYDENSKIYLPLAVKDVFSLFRGDLEETVYPVLFVPELKLVKHNVHFFDENKEKIDTIVCDSEYVELPEVPVKDGYKGYWAKRDASEDIYIENHSWTKYEAGSFVEVTQLDNEFYAWYECDLYELSSILYWFPWEETNVFTYFDNGIRMEAINNLGWIGGGFSTRIPLDFYDVHTIQFDIRGSIKVEHLSALIQYLKDDSYGGLNDVRYSLEDYIQKVDREEWTTVSIEIPRIMNEKVKIPFAIIGEGVTDGQWIEIRNITWLDSDGFSVLIADSLLSLECRKIEFYDENRELITKYLCYNYDVPNWNYISNLPPVPEREGFVGHWEDEEGNIYPEDEAFYLEDDLLVLTSRYIELEKRTVQFCDVNGEVIDEKYCYNDGSLYWDRVSIPNTPNNEDFIGYWEDEEGNIYSEGESLYLEDELTVLTLKYRELEKRKISFYAEDGKLINSMTYIEQSYYGWNRIQVPQPPQKPGMIDSYWIDTEGYIYIENSYMELLDLEQSLTAVYVMDYYDAIIWSVDDSIEPTNKINNIDLWYDHFGEGEFQWEYDSTTFEGQQVIKISTKVIESCGGLIIDPVPFKENATLLVDIYSDTDTTIAIKPYMPDHDTEYMLTGGQWTTIPVRLGNEASVLNKIGIIGREEECVVYIGNIKVTNNETILIPQINLFYCNPIVGHEVEMPYQVVDIEDFDPNYLEVESWNEDVARVEVIGERIFVTGIREGYATIVVRYGDVVSSIELYVEADPNAAIEWPITDVHSEGAGVFIYLDNTNLGLVPSFEDENEATSAVAVDANGNVITIEQYFYINDNALYVITLGAHSNMTLTITGTIAGQNYESVIKIVEGQWDDPNYVPTELLVSPSEVDLAPEITQKITLKTNPNNKALPADAVVTWETENGAIATVSSDGVITGVAEGNTTVTATYEYKEGENLVAIIPVNVLSLEELPLYTVNLNTAYNGAWFFIDVIARDDADSIPVENESIYDIELVGIPSQDYVGGATSIKDGKGVRFGYGFASAAFQAGDHTLKFKIRTENGTAYQFVVEFTGKAGQEQDMTINSQSCELAKLVPAIKFSSNLVLAGEEAVELPLTVTDIPTFDAANLTVTSSAEEVATVAVVDGKILVTGLTAGTSTITATYTDAENEVNVSNELELEVKEELTNLITTVEADKVNSNSLEGDFTNGWTVTYGDTGWQWEAQVKFYTDADLVAGDKYYFSVTLCSESDANNVTVKFDDTVEIVYDTKTQLEAGVEKQVVFTGTVQERRSKEDIVIVLDFGGNPASTVTIKNLILTKM